MIDHSRFINALYRRPVDKTPVWLMRQAGRYLPEYRALREKMPDFIQFCSTPELAAQAAIQPLTRFDLDAAILFSDILVVPAAMGINVQFIKGDGPHFPQPLRGPTDIKRLKNEGEALEKLKYVFETIPLILRNLPRRVPLIGFAGSPWTCATYMVEGGSSKNFAMIKELLYREPAILHELLQRLTSLTIEYLNGQILAGAQAVMLFDSWGGVLSHNDYPIFSLHYLAQIAQGVRSRWADTVPIIFFTKGGGQWLELMAESGCHALGLDWTTSLRAARERVGNKVALQGNTDPSLLLAGPEAIEQAVRSACADFGAGSGHIFNLGHGVLPQTPPENVGVLVEAVHRYTTRANT